MPPFYSIPLFFNKNAKKDRNNSNITTNQSKNLRIINLTLNQKFLRKIKHKIRITILLLQPNKLNLVTRFISLR